MSSTYRWGFATSVFPAGTKDSPLTSEKDDIIQVDIGQISLSAVGLFIQGFVNATYNSKGARFGIRGRIIGRGRHYNRGD
jgi:hypothetical protein